MVFCSHWNMKVFNNSSMANCVALFHLFLILSWSCGETRASRRLVNNVEQKRYSPTVTGTAWNDFWLRATASSTKRNCLNTDHEVVLHYSSRETTKRKEMNNQRYQSRENSASSSNHSTFTVNNRNAVEAEKQMNIKPRGVRSVGGHEEHKTDEPLLPVCLAELSCQANCWSHSNNSSTNASSPKCHCDPYCNLFNDCCADNERYCGKGQLISDPIDQKLFSCSWTFDISRSRMWLVSKCPVNFKPKELFLKCQNVSVRLSGHNIRSHVPVIGENNVLFRNEYCARCNRVKVLEYFGLNISCSVLPPSSINTIEGMVAFALKFCGPLSIGIFKKKHQRAHNCVLPSSYKEIRLVRSCPKGHIYQYNCTNGPVGLVEDYRQPFILYRNIWCSYCWNVSTERLNCSLFAVPPPRPGPPGPPGPSFGHIRSLSLAMDLSSDSHTSRLEVLCPNYDPYLELCRAPLDVLPPVEDFLDKYLVVVWLKTEPQIFSITSANFLSYLKTVFNINSSQVANLNVTEYFNRYLKYALVSFELSLTSEETLRLAKKKKTKVIVNDTQQSNLFAERNGSWSLPLEDLLFFSREFDLVLYSNDTLGNSTFTVFKTSSRQLACIQKRTYVLGDYTKLENDQYCIKSTGKIFGKKDVFFEPSNLKKGKTISVCEKVVFTNCKGKRIVLKPEEYKKFRNLSILYIRTNVKYDFGEYDLENGAVVVCGHNFPAGDSKVPVANENSTQLYLTYLTFIGFLISMISLFLVILTYAIFSELRRLPGKNILSLAVSLFLVQLLWLTAVGRPRPPVVCHVTAVVEHYLFLVSFVAMATIAYHTYSVFSSKAVSRDESPRKEKKKFLRFSAIVWGFPAIFVILCAVIDDQGVYDIYVNDRLQICWFNAKEAQEFMFVLPVSLILAFNVIFFIRTVVVIHRERSEALLLTASSHQRPRTMFWIYLKLSTLMGFSWLFGFMDVLIDSTPVFSYLVVIFASLQGLYMAGAFLWNKRILKMYKKLATRKRSDRSKASPDSRNNLSKYTHTRETRL